MSTARLSIAPLLGIFMVSAGCGSRDFNEDKVRSILEGKPVTLDGEQVSLTTDQVECGVQDDLWDRPTQVGQGSSARLSAKGRELKFSDDVRIEPNYRRPFAQVKGAFTLQVDAVTAIRDGPEQGTKIADVKAGLKIDHACFQNPLPIMGVKKGDFREDTPPVFLFGLHDDGWRIEKLVH